MDKEGIKQENYNNRWYDEYLMRISQDYQTVRSRYIGNPISQDLGAVIADEDYLMIFLGQIAKAEKKSVDMLLSEQSMSQIVQKGLGLLLKEMCLGIIETKLRPV